MKLYKYDKANVQYIPHQTTHLILKLVLVFLLLIASAFWIGVRTGAHSVKPPETVVKLVDADSFTVDKLKSYLRELQIEYPHIVYAQACLETGNFTSSIFRSNHNLFGMREARGRISTNKGAENGHAVYHNWRESVMDYALYQCSYLRNVKSEAEYYAYLRTYYAEDTTYVSKVAQIAKEF